jgi:nicotinamidase-related amidase
MRIKPEEAAAVVIDYQERLMPVIAEKEKLIASSRILLQGLRILEIPLCITQQYTKGLGMTIEEIRKAAGTDEYEEKISFSAYDAILPHIQGKKYVILCGVEAHICVLQTLLDLRENGYIPVLVEDCISSRRLEDKSAALKRAAVEGAVPVTCESLLFELLRVAKTPKSKAIQRLVK